ncbi:hypothetical protein FQN57_004268 [Myotisia sp. PD_48]|nr:hypothetical protein FQN57_004268 [Myotisia sp. PD_48]
MRTSNTLGEALLSQYACPSCTWRIVRRNEVHGTGMPYARRLRAIRQPAPNLLFKQYPSITPQWIPATLRFIHSTTQDGTLLAGSDSTDTHPTITNSNTTIQPQWYSSDLPSNHSRNPPDHSLRQNYICMVLQEAEPGKILAAFLDPENYDAVMSDLPPTTFAEALKLLSPKYFIEPFKRIQRGFRSANAKSCHIEPIADIFARISKDLGTIVLARRHAGHALGLAEYTHLLDCARSMGDAHMADEIWRNMTEDNVRKSVRCYNYYMEAKVWHMAYLSDGGILRSLPYNYKKRRYDIRPRGFQGFSTGRNSTRDEVYLLFDEMAAEGLVADEGTLIQLMTASSREWDIATINQTLKAVWNIDPELLRQNGGSHPPVIQYPISSPLCPTDRLLYAVAHIFCSNNDLATAMQVVDFISTSYNVPISEATWTELLNWSFVLSQDRWGPNAEVNSTGKVPKTSVINILDTMTSPPYDCIPTMFMYDLVWKTAWERQSLNVCLKYMRLGQKLFTTTMAKRKVLSMRLHDECRANNTSERFQNLFQPQTPISPAISANSYPEAFINGIRSSLVPTLTSSKSHWEVYHKFQKIQMAASRELNYLEGWAKFMLVRRRWTSGDYDWERRGLPKFIQEFEDFLLRDVHYHTTGGQVEFEPGEFWSPQKSYRLTLSRF